AGIYRKLIMRGERLTGAILIGDTTLGVRLADLIRNGDTVPAALLSTGGPVAEDEDEDALVCSCHAVTRGTILAAVDRARLRDGLGDAAAVGRVTGAGTGCGTCRGSLAALLRRRPVNAA